MDAQSRADQVRSLKQLKNDLDTSSDNEDDSFEESSDHPKNPRQDLATNGEAKNAMGGWNRKREVKGSYKAKFNIEKLMVEHEKKKILLEDLNSKQTEIQSQLNDLRSSIGKKVQSGDLNDVKAQSSKCHWDFLLKEMKWMSEDFDRESKKKRSDAKKQSRTCKKQLQEKKLKKEKELKDQKVEVRRKAQQMGRMVQQFWKSVEKVVKHNYNIAYEKKRQQIRTKRLESFVSKHLKLSVKVAEELNTKSFVEQSMQNEGVLGKRDRPEDEIQLKLYTSDNEVVEPEVTKKQKLTLTVKKNKDGSYEYDEHQQQQMLQQDDLSQSKQLSRALIAEQTVQMAQSFQPTGFTLSSVNVKTKVPFLLQGCLREYQIIGLDWLVTLHNKKLNGILADEMGLGKTIQTISMLASLACDKGIWGPHLIVVPTTIIINWEMEFKKWCPAFKILTYFGSQKERKMKRHGWSKENSFHVCITSYKLVIQDHFAFRRKKWYYMILDEAQNIKNFKSQRWQTLLRFNTKRRLLLTGTPLQNDVMELWSLMHFLMPNIFSSQQDFKEWFSNPFNQSITQNQSLNITVVQKLQSILRPFLLRRMKRDVEKQLPEKVEHIVQCNLSRRQRLLYDEYINSDKTKQTLTDSDFFSIMNVLMQLRKVCNHPDLFEARTIESPFIQLERVKLGWSSTIYKAMQYNPLKDISFKNLDLILSEHETMSQQEYTRSIELFPKRPLIQVIAQHKSHLQNLSEHLLQTRPLADGYALGKRLPINCNVFAKPNTQSLKQTLPNILPYESNIYHDIPNYLNTACLPFAQHFYSLESYDQIRYSSRIKEFTESEVYLSALKDEEQRLLLLRFAKKLIQWRAIDTMNRTNLIMSKPIYGEDLRRAVKVNLLFGDIFDVKRHKTLDLTNRRNASALADLDRAPQSILNPTLTYPQASQCNFLEDWPELTEEALEIDYRGVTGSLVKEVPMSQQIRNKKRKQQLKQQLIEQQQKAIQLQIEQQQQQQLQQQQSEVNEERIVQIEKEITIILDMKEIKEGMTKTMEEGEDNPNVQVEINEVERVEIRKIESMNLQMLPLINLNQDVEMKESPYQRIYQNASKRFKKEDEAMQDEDGEKPQQNEGEPDQNSRQSTVPGGNGNQEQSVQESPNIPDKDFLEIPVNGNDSQQQQQQQEIQQPKPATPDFKITYRNCESLRDLIVTPLQRVSNLEDQIKHFKFIIPKCVAKPVDFIPSKIVTKHSKEQAYERFAYQKLMSHRNVNQSLKYSNILFFPHKNLIQYDCGKLQRLAQLLKTLHSKGHKVLIFTQMTRILDILEQFLNLHGYTYVRLDGSVKVEMRQRLVDKFNLNKKIFCFISSTRCGGIGINLTGADCVIFYDTDWNPAMDKQAQDRCHRIGQTKTVHIYRLISVNTIEENIFKKSLQKRDFGGLIIEGSFDMEMFKKVSLKDILEDESIFRPKRRDLMKEENIMFHTTAETGMLAEQEMDYDKQRELEQYRKRFEEALVRIEDKEDVIALQQAKREIDDEFDEDALPQDPQAQSGTTTTTVAVAPTDPTVPQQPQPAQDEEVKALDSKSAAQLSKDLKRSEVIDWRDHPTLNNVTKMAIGYFEGNYNFDQYLEDRSKKDNKFVKPDEEKDEKEESEFSLSGGEEDLEDEERSEEKMAMEWDRVKADEIYKQTRGEIESKYFVV